jgi:hypothetical protein
VSAADRTGEHRMMAVDFLPSSAQRVGPPRVLFAFDNLDVSFQCVPRRCYDVAPDGQRFYVVRTAARPPAPAVTHINFVENWFEELKAKVPVAN